MRRDPRLFQCPQPERNQPAGARILQDEDARVPELRFDKRERPIAVPGLERRVVREGKWAPVVPAAFRRGEDCLVEHHKGHGLEITAFVLPGRRHQRPRRRDAEMNERTCQGGRSAAVHSENQDSASRAVGRCHRIRFSRMGWRVQTGGPSRVGKSAIFGGIRQGHVGTALWSS